MNALNGSERWTSAEDNSRKHRTSLVTLLFTDMVGSTELKQKLGDRAGSAFFDRHHGIVRETLQHLSGGQEIETAGDSFLLLFSTPSDAVQFALLLQARLRSLARENGLSALDRIGIHVGEVVIKDQPQGQKPKDLYGIQIDACSRVMSLAHAGQILMTRSVFDSARQVLKGEDIEGVAALEWLNHGPYLLKGLDEAVEICEVRETGQQTGGPPTSSEKAQRRVAVGDEQVLGWRPAVGQLIPNTKWVLQEKLGEGGFGEVWLGLHQTMKERRVFKFCFQAERVRFLKRELTLFRLLKERIGDHPNIVRLHEVFLDEPPCYVEMDYVEGKDLRRWCEDHGGIGKIPLETRLEIVAQAADALKAAHESGIIHRDVKPTNILVGGKGVGAREIHVKLTDFGIGQVVSQEYLAGITRAGFTQTLSPSSSSSQTGTHLYMAPELMAGRPASTSADIYSLGVVLYQLLVEDFSEPVTTDWTDKISDPVLREDLKLCFAGDPTHRFTGVGQLAENLRTLDERRRSFLSQERQVRMRKQVKVAAVAALVLLLGLSTAWFYSRNAKTRWAREKALPEIARLADAEEFSAALALARQVAAYIPNDPVLTNLLDKISAVISVETSPAGALVHVKDYSKPDSAWRLLGRSPIKDLRNPLGFYRWRIQRDGYEPIERASSLLTRKLEFTLDPIGTHPPGMVKIPKGSFGLQLAGLDHLDPVELEDFLIDKFEVTNEEYQKFVDAGGYQRTNYWIYPTFKEGKVLSWEQAMAEFLDQTGKPGPSTWSNGSYPAGQEKHPVSGVSWYEAAAYAQFVGKRLPTVFHWHRAAGTEASTRIVPLSNFNKQGTAPIGKYHGMSPSGTVDMAGNVKEWSWNDDGAGKRCVLGGAWNEPDYMFFLWVDVAAPWERSPTRGFRCMQSLAPLDQAPRTLEPVVPARRDYRAENQASDEVFQAYKALYSYDKTPLNATIETVAENSDRWRREKITYSAAYGNERIRAHLFLPKKNSPPYETVIFFPGANALQATSSDTDLVRTEIVEILSDSGRAVLYPVYKGTYERKIGLRNSKVNPTAAYRDFTVQVVKDFLRSIDYLQTRQDIDLNKLGYVGTSWGGRMATILLALEDRVKAGVLIIGGLPMQKALPEVDHINFVSRVKVPILMLNGRYDSIFPLEASQKPMFDLIGTSTKDKRHVVYDMGHQTPPMGELKKEMITWLDKYLGPVK